MRALYVRRVFEVDLHYIFGRFRSVRWLFSRWKRLRDRFNGQSLPPLDGLPASEIVRLAPRTAVKELQKTALTQCIVIPPAMVEEIVQFARQTECKLGAGNAPPFRYTDVQNARLPDGTVVPLAYCRNPTECPAVCKVRDDPVLQAITANYLGYTPRSGDVRLYWGFVGDVTDEERRHMFQTIDYHFDVHDYNFCYAHVYLTDTDVQSGSHVMVLGSHNSKPLRWLFNSSRQTDEAIENHYGKEKVVCLEGAAGSGFVEDTSCYHKALAPLSAERLMLQVRYH
ncbi:MAG TPA: hypothetical protein VH575_23320 [Gemmataceae bacterium]|jgi:hypothetical protein